MLRTFKMFMMALIAFYLATLLLKKKGGGGEEEKRGWGVGVEELVFGANQLASLVLKAGGKMIVFGFLSSDEGLTLAAFKASAHTYWQNSQ